ncbi:MAG: cytochrome c1 [Pseudomonadota bacterium]
MRNIKYFGFFILLGFLCLGEALIAEDQAIPPRQVWSFSGPTGTFDKAQLQRGFQVYKEVCSACHSLNLLSYRNLEALGFSKEGVKAIAKEHLVRDGPNQDGEMFERPGRSSDHFHAPFPNEQAARVANNGAYPPDLSVITKARAYGPDYVHAILTGYHDQPPNAEVSEGMYYNLYFDGHQIAMAPPLVNEQVTYSDGTMASVDQMSKDVTAFLSWAGEPEMEVRKRTGIMVMIYLAFLTLFLYLTMKRIWAPLYRGYSSVEIGRGAGGKSH